MSKILYGYPLPLENPNCLCENGMQQFFCQTGHLTECHSGMNCDAASCSHLSKYCNDLNDYEVQTAPAWQVSVFHLQKLIVSFPVYAPQPSAAERIVREWIARTENLSRLGNEIRLKITGVGSDAEEAIAS